MAINYSRLETRSAALLASNGRKATLRRTHAVQRVNGHEIKPADDILTVTGVMTQYSPHEISSGLLQAGDMKFVATAAIEIKIGDVLEVDGQKWRVEQPNPVKPANVVLVYKCQLRRVG